MTFGEALGIALERQEMKAAELSERSGVSASYISKLFSGRVKEPTWSKANAIIDALGITPSEFRKIQGI